ncbi:hypothetical protein HDV05_006502 [Chytridiales sp. JEL 0842]|nr:hypothetical protein HDV05_006502 [Chytridiales sp. JEL 0842]
MISQGGAPGTLAGQIMVGAGGPGPSPTGLGGPGANGGAGGVVDAQGRRSIHIDSQPQPPRPRPVVTQAASVTAPAFSQPNNNPFGQRPPATMDTAIEKKLHDPHHQHSKLQQHSQQPLSNQQQHLQHHNHQQHHHPKAPQQHPPFRNDHQPHSHQSPPHNISHHAGPPQPHPHPAQHHNHQGHPYPHHHQQHHQPPFNQPQPQHPPSHHHHQSRPHQHVPPQHHHQTPAHPFNAQTHNKPPTAPPTQHQQQPQPQPQPHPQPHQQQQRPVPQGQAHNNKHPEGHGDSELPPPPFSIGSTVDQGNITLLDFVGQGSFAHVYFAFDNLTSSNCAVKCIHKLGLDPARLAVQKREVHALEDLRGHPNIVRLIRVVDAGEWLLIIMEFCELDLFEAIMQKGGFPDGTVKHIFAQLCDGLIHCHSRGYYHRDLKPENCLIDVRTMQIKLTDFGLTTRDTWSNELGCGSARYMAPEACACADPLKGYSPMSGDVWALGIILINLLFSKNPWYEATPTDPIFSQFVGSKPDILRHHFGISAEFNSILKRVFALDPALRFPLPEFKKLILALPKFVDDPSPSQPPPVPSRGLVGDGQQNDVKADIGTTVIPSNGSGPVPPGSVSTASVLTIDEGPLVVFGKIPNQKLQNLHDSRNPFSQRTSSVLPQPQKAALASNDGGGGLSSSARSSMEGFSIIVDATKSAGTTALRLPPTHGNNRNPFAERKDNVISGENQSEFVLQSSTNGAPTSPSGTAIQTPFDGDLAGANAGSSVVSPSPATANPVSPIPASNKIPLSDPDSEKPLSGTNPSKNPLSLAPNADGLNQPTAQISASDVTIDSSNSPWTFIWPGASRVAAPEVPQSLALGREGIGRLGISRLGLSTRPSRALSSFTAFGMGDDDDGYFFGDELEGWGDDDDEDDEYDGLGGMEGGQRIRHSAVAGSRVPDEESHFEAVRVDRRIIPDLERGMKASGGRRSKLGAGVSGKFRKFVPLLGGQSQFAHLTGGGGNLVETNLHLGAKDAGGLSNSDMEGFMQLPGGFVNQSSPTRPDEANHSNLGSGPKSSTSSSEGHDDMDRNQPHYQRALHSISKVYQNLFRTNYKPRLAIDPISGLPLHQFDSDLKQSHPNIVTETILPPPEHPSVAIMTASAAKEGAGSTDKASDQDFEKLIKSISAISPPRAYPLVGTGSGGAGGSNEDMPVSGNSAGWRHRFRRRVNATAAGLGHDTTSSPQQQNAQLLSAEASPSSVISPQTKSAPTSATVPHLPSNHHPHHLPHSHMNNSAEHLRQPSHSTDIMGHKSKSPGLNPILHAKSADSVNDYHNPIDSTDSQRRKSSFELSTSARQHPSVVYHDHNQGPRPVQLPQPLVPLPYQPSSSTLTSGRSSAAINTQQSTSSFVDMPMSPGLNPFDAPTVTMADSRASTISSIMNPFQSTPLPPSAYNTHQGTLTISTQSAVPQHHSQPRKHDTHRYNSTSLRPSTDNTGSMKNRVDPIGEASSATTAATPFDDMRSTTLPLHTNTVQSPANPPQSLLPPHTNNHHRNPSVTSITPRVDDTLYVEMVSPPAHNLNTSNPFLNLPGSSASSTPMYGSVSAAHMYPSTPFDADHDKLDPLGDNFQGIGGPSIVGRRHSGINLAKPIGQPPTITTVPQAPSSTSTGLASIIAKTMADPTIVTARMAKQHARHTSFLEPSSSGKPRASATSTASKRASRMSDHSIVSVGGYTFDNHEVGRRSSTIGGGTTQSRWDDSSAAMSEGGEADSTFDDETSSRPYEPLEELGGIHIRQPESPLDDDVEGGMMSPDDSLPSHIRDNDEDDNDDDTADAPPRAYMSGSSSSPHAGFADEEDDFDDSDGMSDVDLGMVNGRPANSKKLGGMMNGKSFSMKNIADKSKKKKKKSRSSSANTSDDDKSGDDDEDHNHSSPFGARRFVRGAFEALRGFMVTVGKGQSDPMSVQVPGELGSRGV